MFVLQHALTQGVIRRRAPFDPNVSTAVRDALEEGDWMTIVSLSGLFSPVNGGAPNSRVAWPIVIEPSQPDAISAGLTVVHGDYMAQTDRFAADPAFTGYAGSDVPGAARVAPAYAGGGALVAIGFDPAAGLAGATATKVHGLTTALTSGAEAAFIVAYVERTPAHNNNRLQLVVF